MSVLDRDLELELFYRDCNRILKERNFDYYLDKETEEVYYSIRNPGNGRICQYCKYRNEETKKCQLKPKKALEIRACRNARNIKLLTEAGLYGQKTTT